MRCTGKVSLLKRCVDGTRDRPLAGTILKELPSPGSLFVMSYSRLSIFRPVLERATSATRRGAEDPNQRRGAQATSSPFCKVTSTLGTDADFPSTPSFCYRSSDEG